MKWVNIVRTILGLIAVIIGIVMVVKFNSLVPPLLSGIAFIVLGGSEVLRIWE